MTRKLSKEQHLHNQMVDIKRSRTDLFKFKVERAEGMAKRNKSIKPLREIKDSICKAGPDITDNGNLERLTRLKKTTIDLGVKEAELESYKTTMDKKIAGAEKRLFEAIDRDQLKLFTDKELNPPPAKKTAKKKAGKRKTK